MGLLRLALAFCVFCGHATNFGIPVLRGFTAVEIFFVISGFYMQLILSNVYTPQRLGPAWLKSFYLNRYLRIAPTYAIAAVSTVVVAAGYTLIRPGLDVDPLSAWDAINQLRNSIPNALLKIYLLLTNALVFFQDAALFIGVQAGNARFVADFSNSQIQIYEALAVPQAWSVGIELSFYMLAPVLFKLSTGRLAGLAIGLFACKAAFLSLFGGSLGSLLGIPAISNLDSLWGYRFLPFELSYFLAGAIGYRCIDRVKALVGEVQQHKKIIAYSSVLLAVTVASRLIEGPVIHWIYPFAFAAAAPLLFCLFQHSAQDKALGDLSYPFYMLHVLALRIASPFQTATLQVLSPLLALILTLVLSAACIKSEGWIERIRQRLKTAQPCADPARLQAPG